MDETLTQPEIDILRLAVDASGNPVYTAATIPADRLHRRGFVAAKPIRRTKSGMIGRVIVSLPEGVLWLQQYERGEA